MPDSTEVSRRVEVWVAMAHHFLDTETRHELPWTALRCVEAGLSVHEARDVWRYEVSPAVAFNLFDVAGEWAGWDREWLVERIERLRRRWDNAPGTLRWLRYRLRVHVAHGYWVAIERCLQVLLSWPDPEQRRQAAADLAWLGRHYFDFTRSDDTTIDPERTARLRALYPEPFRRAMQPVTYGEGRAAHQRVAAALQEAGKGASP